MSAKWNRQATYTFGRSNAGCERGYVIIFRRMPGWVFVADGTGMDGSGEEIVENGLPYREEVLLLVFETWGGFNFGSIGTRVVPAVALAAWHEEEEEEEEVTMIIKDLCFYIEKTEDLWGWCNVYGRYNLLVDIHPWDGLWMFVISMDMHDPPGWRVIYSFTGYPDHIPAKHTWPSYQEHARERVRLYQLRRQKSPSRSQ